MSEPETPEAETRDPELPLSAPDEAAGTETPEAEASGDAPPAPAPGDGEPEPKLEIEPEPEPEPEPAREGGSAAPEESVLAEFAPLGAEWGYVDEEGNVRQKGGEQGADRIVGPSAGQTAERALGLFAYKFQQITDKVDSLERDVQRAADKSRFLGRIHSMLQWVPQADALGDFDALVARLQQLEEQSQEQLTAHLALKEALCERAVALQDSSEWNKTTEALKSLQAEWKAIGAVPKEQAEAVWGRFRGAMDHFFARRKAYFDDISQEHQANLARKAELCERAEGLKDSEEWNQTAEALKALQAEWKAIGPVPKDQAETVWSRFRGAMDQFFERRKGHFNQIERELRDNLRSKEALCEKAEGLAESTDWRETSEALKNLQAEWKAIGPVPRKKSDALWQRFRGAMDQFYSRRAAASGAGGGGGRERGGGGGGGSEWRLRLQETLERKQEQAERIRESLQRDEENLSRWQETLANLRPGGRAAEVRAGLDEKIGAVEGKRASKQSRLQELEEALREIEGRLGSAPA
jgi:DNA repair exonuclease SbcCD ATPase subunit